jgi:hypothetical protein
MIKIGVKKLKWQIFEYGGNNRSSYLLLVLTPMSTKDCFYKIQILSMKKLSFLLYNTTLFISLFFFTSSRVLCTLYFFILNFRVQPLKGQTFMDGGVLAPPFHRKCHI